MTISKKENQLNDIIEHFNDFCKSVIIAKVFFFFLITLSQYTERRKKTYDIFLFKKKKRIISDEHMSICLMKYKTLWLYIFKIIFFLKDILLLNLFIIYLYL